MYAGQFLHVGIRPCSQDCPPQSYYGVFDGHVGVEAAAYAAVHLLPNLVRHPLFCTDPETAMKGAFKTTDEHFCEKVGSWEL